MIAVISWNKMYSVLDFKEFFSSVNQSKAAYIVGNCIVDNEKIVGGEIRFHLQRVHEKAMNLLKRKQILKLKRNVCNSMPREIK